jgi:hypothetical protein
MESELAVLRVVRLKGRPATADVAGATGMSEQEAEAALNELAQGGTLKEANGRYMLDPSAKDRLAELLEQERGTIDQDQLRSLYEEFDQHNTEMKEIMHAWQLRDGEPNDHSDADYDQGVIDRLVKLHENFAPLVEKIIGVFPRLEPYGQRFASALEKVKGGDHSWIAKPIADSYHTVWFEFHEELIEGLGLSREAEAASGRAE